MPEMRVLKKFGPFFALFLQIYSSKNPAASFSGPSDFFAVHLGFAAEISAPWQHCISVSEENVGTVRVCCLLNIDAVFIKFTIPRCAVFIQQPK
jgi:hypothetical protein